MQRRLKVGDPYLPLPNRNPPKGAKGEPKSFQGPFVETVGFLLALKSTPINVYLPLPAMHTFIKGETALEFLQESILNKVEERTVKTDADTFQEEQQLIALRLVNQMKKEYEKVKDQGTVWFAEIDASFKYDHNLVMILPSQQDKLQEWLDGGPLNSLAKAIQYSPLLGVDFVGALESFVGAAEKQREE